MCMCGHLCLSVGCCTDKSFVAACSNFAYTDRHITCISIGDCNN